MSTHLANPSRLNKRVTVDDGKEGSSNTRNSWNPSRNIKIYVSKLVYKELSRPGHKYVAFDYNYLRIEEYHDRRRVCDNCGLVGYHHAGVCRRASHCHICGGNHPASQCMAKQKPLVKDKENTTNSSPRIGEEDMEFHDCSNSVSSSSSLKDWDKVTTRDQPVNSSEMSKPPFQWPGRTPGHA